MKFCCAFKSLLENSLQVSFAQLTSRISQLAQLDISKITLQTSVKNRSFNPIFSSVILSFHQLQREASLLTELQRDVLRASSLSRSSKPFLTERCISQRKHFLHASAWCCAWMQALPGKTYSRVRGSVLELIKLRVSAAG